ncbi:MAG: zinc-dependent metalloprotease [Acidimicrobiia bacterium]
MNPNDNPNDDENENQFGFNIDPESISGMINEMLSGSAFSMGQNMQGGPMGIAERVAADIASKEIEDGAVDQNEIATPSQQDPMLEIMNIMSMLSTPPTKTLALNIDKEFLARCEQIFPAAQNYVSGVTNSDAINSIELQVTDRVTWTKDYLTSMKGPLEVASKSLSPTFDDGTNEQNQQMGFDIQSMIAKSIAPMMFGVQAGTMLGFLSHRVYGDDDILLPVRLDNRVGLIASAVQKFIDEWSVEADGAILYFLILQSVRAHIRKTSWLTNKLDDLCTKYVAAYELNPYKLQELMSDIDMSNPESITAISVTPEQMFETLRTPAHDVLDEEIGIISSLHDAYVDYLVHKNLSQLLPDYHVIQEARKRITVTTSDADRFIEQLFGVATTRTEKQEASDFINGVIERDQEELLHKLFIDERYIPTESEFAAPGLWLARIELM